VSVLKGNLIGSSALKTEMTSALVNPSATPLKNYSEWTIFLSLVILVSFGFVESSFPVP
jgi:hypothetical protein